MTRNTKIAVLSLLFSFALLALGPLGCGASSDGSTHTDEDVAQQDDTQQLQDATERDTGAARAEDSASSEGGDSLQDALSSGDSDALATNQDAGAKGQTSWGPIVGACGEVSAQLKVNTPSFLVTTWNFKTSSTFDPAGLSVGAKKRYEGENAGGSSICSEVMSMQLLHECEGAVLVKTETEVGYRQQGSITDYLTKIDGELVGVSVTRAYKGPKIQTYTAADALKLLNKKLTGVNESTKNVRSEDKWVKQVLHIWTMHPDWVPILKDAWDSLDATIRSDTVVLITVENNSIYVTADTCDEEN